VRDISIDVARHEVLVRGEKVELTRTEFRLLQCLAQHAGRVVQARALLREAQEYDCEDREAQDIVKVHIRHLRHKIEPNPQNPQYIMNVRGVGYMLETAPPEQPGL
jgi:DNA-binding response OmpR family regulator